MMLALMSTGLRAQTQFITDVMLIGCLQNETLQNLKLTYENQGWICINMDLNMGAGHTPRHIYLLYKTNSCTGSSGTPITSFYLKNVADNNSFSSFTDNGFTYNYTSGAGDDYFHSTSHCNLNCSAGGNEIYLCYSKTPADYGIAVSSISITGSSTMAVGSNGGSIPCNLNDGAGGTELYMHITKATNQSPMVVTNEAQLNKAVSASNGNIQLGGDILLSSYLNIVGWPVNIDLNGHKLYRNITGGHNSQGHVIYVHNNATLNLTNTHTTATGYIEGGMALNGGAIFIEPGSTVTTNKVTFRNNSASEHAGAIWNGGSLTSTNSTFMNNTGNDVGGIYNAVVENSFFGSATFNNCTFIGNTSSVSAGALANAQGSTSMTLNNCIISGNTAATNGGGIWNGGTLTINGGSITGNMVGENGGGIYHLYGTLKMSGDIVVTGNTRDSYRNNLYLASGKIITVNGAFTSDTRIGLTAESENTALTSGFNTYHYSSDPAQSHEPSEFFLSDDAYYTVTRINSEVKLSPGNINYIAADGSNATQSTCNKISAITDANGVSLSSGWYLVNQNKIFNNRINVNGDVHLILADDNTLTAPKGIHVASGKSLTIYGQNGQNGQLTVSNPDDYNAGIGGESFYYRNDASLGAITINGGIVTVQGGYRAAGIGVGGTDNTDDGVNSGSITINGGTVTANGGTKGAAIGGGFNSSATTITINGGTVTAVAGSGAAGIGGGEYACGKSITITGGVVTATGGLDGDEDVDKGGAGIGGGNDQDGSTVITISGGIINATSTAPMTPGIGHGTDRSYNHRASDATTTLTWTDESIYTESIYATSYGGTVTFSKAFATTDGSIINETGGIATNRIEGKTLVPFVAIVLNDNDDNTQIINDNIGSGRNINISGRTLRANGSWNTLCLPFSRTSLTGSLLENFMVMELSSTSNLTDGTLTLNFEEANNIEAGKPYFLCRNSGLLIYTSADWDAFAARVNAGETTLDACLAADITVTTMVGTLENPYQGNFDGLGHTLTIKYGTSDSRLDETYIAAFHYVNNATFKNLTVAGNIYTTTQYAGCVVGRMTGENNSITSCIVLGDINSSSGSGYLGGYVGRCLENTECAFTNCAFRGSMTAPGLSCAGLVGHSEIDNGSFLYFTNILIMPHETTAGSRRAIVWNANGSHYTTRNSYSSSNKWMGDGVDVCTSWSNPRFAEALGSDWEIRNGRAVPKLIGVNFIDPLFNLVTVESTAPTDVPVGSNVTLKGCYTPVSIGENGDNTKLFLDENNLFFYPKNGEGLNGFYAYLQLNNGLTTADIDAVVVNWGKTSVQKFYNAGQWQAIAPALVDGATTLALDATNLTHGDYDMFAYDESNATWRNQKSGSAAVGFNTLNRGQGYIYRHTEGTTLAMNGTKTTGDVDGTILGYTDAAANLKGFNLVGNPYTHAIYSGVGFSSNNIATGFYTLQPDGSWLAHADGKVAVGEAFLVQANGDNPFLSFADNASVSQAKGAAPTTLTFMVSDGEHKDVAYALIENGELKIENSGLKKVGHLNEATPMLFIPQEGTDYAVANIPADADEFPLSFNGQAGEYTIAITDSQFSIYNYLHLIDLQTGRDIDLLQQPSYTFKTKGDARFLVRLTPDNSQSSTTNSQFAYRSDDDIVITGIGTLQVFDILGRQLFTKEITTFNSQFSISNFPGSGVYILRLNDQTQKIVIK